MAVLTVTNPDDSGSGSLREAIGLANAAADLDTIVFAAGLAGQTITLTSGELALTNDVIIDGDVNGDDKADITISGNGASRIIHVRTIGTDVTLASLTLTDGNTNGSGGAILTDNGTNLVLTDVTVKDSAARRGGGIYIDGGNHVYAPGTPPLDESTLVAINVTITGNHADISGGGVHADERGTATFINATIHGNSTDGSGGGIRSSGQNSLVIQGSTITGNTAGVGGGGTYTVDALAPRVIRNSVVAGNLAAGAADDVHGGGNLAAGYNFFGTDVSGLVTSDFGGNIQSGGDPLLGALQDNGGTVWTRAIQTGSGLVGAGSIFLVPTDTLDIDGDGDIAETLPLDAHGGLRLVGATVDIGAYEYAPNGTAGADRLVFGAGAQNIAGGLSADTIDTGAGNDTIDGGDGNDVIVGGAGADSIDGGTGDDRASYRFSTGVFLDLAIPANGSGDAAGDTYANVESFVGSALHGDTLSGSGNDEYFFGLGGADVLVGFGGNDTLVGGTGADTLTGGKGRDVMTGGEGSDVFVFQLLADAGTGSNRDVITDFSHGNDLIDLTALGPTFVTNFTGGGAAEVRIVDKANGTYIQIDGPDAGQQPDFEIFLRGAHGITVDDLILGVAV